VVLLYGARADSRNQLSEDNDVQRYVMVYDVPKAWLDKLKKNKLKSSQYVKQTVMERLQRDCLI
jgi:hypothetical protein